MKLDWKTGNEFDHLGFNVFRSDEDGRNYEQINDSLILASFNPSSFHGEYNFIDFNVENGKTYYYYLQDVSLYGVTSTHGPLIATPDYLLGEISENNPTTPPVDNSDNQDETYKDLGDGIYILSQNRKFMRIKIKPSTLSILPSTQNSTYDELIIEGYNNSLTPGSPSLPTRKILIPLNEEIESFEIVNQSIAEHKDVANVVPAPLWKENVDGNLEPIWSFDEAIYEANNYTNENYVQIISNEAKATKDYLSLSITPVKFNPVTKEIIKLDELILDLEFTLKELSTNTKEEESPYSEDEAIRLTYDKPGMYHLSYGDFKNSNTDNLLKNIPTNELRLYLGDTEMPIEVHSNGEYFSTEDYIRFYLPYQEHFEDKNNFAILTGKEKYSNFNEPLRIETLDGKIDQGLPSRHSESIYFAKSEENIDPLFSFPLGTNVDHFFWKHIFAPYPKDPSREFLIMPIDLFNLNSQSEQDVVLKIYVKGIPAANIEINHHIEISVNNFNYVLDEHTFKGNDYTVLKTTLPSYYFFDGTNKVKVRVVGDMVPSGDSERIMVDKIEAVYYGFRTSNPSGITSITNIEKDSIITVSNFENPKEVEIYDITSIDNTKKVINFYHQNDQISFFANSGESYQNGVNYILLKKGNGLKPNSIKLSNGHNFSLKSQSNQADMIIIGEQTLLEATNDLVEKRESEGLSVHKIDLQHIYDEFSNGIKKSSAIREFVEYASTNWTLPHPQYLLILGDATFDPNDYFENMNDKILMPMPLVEGMYYDFGSDNWLATETIEDKFHLPYLAIGRIPSSNPTVIRKYVEKVIRYESGDLDSNILNSFSFIADRSTNNEQFEKKIENLSNIDVFNFSKNLYFRKEMSDTELNKKILNDINNGSFMMTYMGHGAEDRWSDTLRVLRNSDARNLKNESLPIILALTCLNSYFYDPDVEYKSIGEEFVLNSEGGAIAFIGSTTMTTPTAQEQFAAELFKEMNNTFKNGEYNSRLGNIFLKAKYSLGEASYSKDIINSYMIMGDPSLKLPEKFFNNSSKSIEFITQPTINNQPATSAGSGCTAHASNGTNSNTNKMDIMFLFIFAFLVRRATLLLYRQ